MKRKLVKVLGLSYSQSQTGSYVLILAENKGKGKLPVMITYKQRAKSGRAGI